MTTPRIIENTPSENLHTLYLTTEDELRILEIRLHDIEIVWLARMDAKGTTTIPGVCEQTQKTDYDITAYTPLKEIIGTDNPEELAKIFTPGHYENTWIPDKWQPAGTVLAVSKRVGGDAAVACVERAKIRQPPRLKIIRPKVEKGASASDDS